MHGRSVSRALAKEEKTPSKRKFWRAIIGWRDASHSRRRERRGGWGEWEEDDEEDEEDNKCAMYLNPPMM